MNNLARYQDFQYAAIGKPLFVAKEKKVLHLIRNGALVYTWLDLETTDKEWMHLEMTVASLTTTDIAYNLLSDDLYEVCVPDRVGLSPEAMLITRYMAEDVRNPKRLSPQHAVAKIFEDVQAAPLKLWNKLGSVRGTLGDELWNAYIEEKEIIIPGKSGKEKEVLVRHMPLLDDNNKIVRNVRVHEPSPTREFLQMSYKTDEVKFDYEDEYGRWRVRNLDKFNLGFRNTFFDNRAMAAALFRANFPLKEIYAMNKKGLGNHAVDVFTAAIADYFFSHNGRERLALGERRDAETGRMKISAKLDLIMDQNTRIADPDIGMPPGVRVYDGTLHNLKKGHNAPDYDNAKSIGVHAYLRETDGDLLAHIESLGNIEHFRRFMTFDNEQGVPTTHPVRFIITSANDDKIYRAIPVFVLGSDDEHGKFNRIWAMRADIDYRYHRVEGKLITEMTDTELSVLMKTQRGQLGAIFHEIHLKRHRGVVDAETGLRAGLCPGHSADTLRYMRDYVIDNYDESDRRFLPKVMKAFGRQNVFAPPADNMAQPYVEEEIWTAMGEVKYTYVEADDGTAVHLPPVIRDMAQNEFDRVNHRIGDTLRSLIRVQPLELEWSAEKAYDYAELRRDKEKKLARYQEKGKSSIVTLPYAQYNDEFLSKKSNLPVPIEDIYVTMIEDKLHLMDKIVETTRAYEVQRLVASIDPARPKWQRIPFKELARIPESRLVSLKDAGCLRVVFEPNPNRPSYRFMLRYFMENRMEELLSASHREFYHAETAFYNNGPPYIKNALDHKAMSWPKQKISIEKIRTNEHPGHRYMSAGRAGEKGAHDIFAREDMAEAILFSIERDGRRISKAYLLTPARKLLFGIDPVTNRALPHVKYEIPKKHTVVTVPDVHTSMTASHPRFGHLCLAVEDSSKLHKARHIVVEEEKTGRRYLAADPVVNELPPRTQGQYDDFYKAADAAYAQSGKKPISQGFVLSCSELAPISKTTNDPKYPALHIPQEKLMATRAPMLANLRREEPLTGFIRRKYDLVLKEDQKIRLRGTDHKGEDTGWEATASIKADPEIFTLQQFLDDLQNPEKADKMKRMAFACGFDTTDHLKAHLLEEFTKFDEQIADVNNVLIFFEISPVKKISYWTNKQPRACFERKEEQQKKPRMKKQKPGLKLEGKKKQIIQFNM